MAMEMKGLKALKLNLGKVDNAVSGPGLKRSLGAAGFVAEGIAKAIVVAKDILDTGFLLSTVQSKEPFLVSGGGFVEVGVAAEYAVHHEFGTSKMAARPFMRPTIVEGKPKIQGAFSTTMKSEINNAIR